MAAPVPHVAGQPAGITAGELAILALRVVLQQAHRDAVMRAAAWDALWPHKQAELKQAALPPSLRCPSCPSLSPSLPYFPVFTTSPPSLPSTLLPPALPAMLSPVCAGVAGRLCTARRRFLAPPGYAHAELRG